MQNRIFTIGHSNQSLDAFLALLQMHHVNLVADVRSSPVSRYTPQFNADNLTAALSRTGINYAFFGKELGGRPADRSCYDDDGRVSYDLLAQTPLFNDGVQRLVSHLRVRRIAVMCSEKEPLDCHRSLLIARVLEERVVQVEHILDDGAVEKHDETMGRLMESLKLPPRGDMFRTREDVIDVAIARRARRVAYVDAEQPSAYGRH